LVSFMVVVARVLLTAAALLGAEAFGMARGHFLTSRPARAGVARASELAGELVDLRSTLESLEALAHHDSEKAVVGAAVEVSAADTEAMSSARDAIEALAMDARGSPRESALSLAAASKTAKRILASNETHASKLEALAGLAETALDARRPHTAWAVVSLGVARLGKWRATSRWVPMGRPLLRAALRTLAALRELAEFEAWLRRSEAELGEPLNAEPLLLSAAMGAAAAAGWEQHALAMNASLADGGGAPTTAALNALMRARLDRTERGGDAAADAASKAGANFSLTVFVQMRFTREPAPDRTSQMLAVRACGRRKTGSWSALRNLMRRPWLKLAWNPASANEAVAALVRAGNLRAASSAAAHLHATRMPVTPAPFVELLRFASGPRESYGETLLVFDALERRLAATGAPLPAAALLLLLRRLRVPAREALLLRGARDCALAPDAALLLGAAALHWASEGGAQRAAALLGWMAREGYDLARLDGEGWLAAAFCDELAPPRYLEQRGRFGALSQAGEALPGGGCRSLWELALRACGDADGAEALGDAMEESGVLDLEGGRGAPLAVELIGACCAKGSIDAAALTLRRLGPHAPPLAYILVAEGCCAEAVPRMALARATMGAMSDAGALGVASVAEVVRVYAALIRGYGSLAKLDDAHGAFQEARQWLVGASGDWMRERDAAEWAAAERAAQLYVAGLQEAEGAASRLTSAASPAAGTTASAGKRRRGKGGRGGGGAGGRSGGGEAGPAEAGGGRRGARTRDLWQEADGTLVDAMVEAAAQHPRGLGLACTLLESAVERGSVVRVEGYYQQLIHGHATAEELQASNGDLWPPLMRSHGL